VAAPFDAVLVIAFGGPGGPSDVRPFLDNVVRGRRVPGSRLQEVAAHYALFDGVSPITALTLQQAAGLQARLQAASLPLPVSVGMRNWHPYLADTLAALSRTGSRRVIGFIAAPHRSYSSCAQYRENVADARAALARGGLKDVAVTYVADWHAHPDYIAACADRALAAIAALPIDLRAAARLVFTAHSIPESQAARYPYRAQFEETAERVHHAVEQADGVRRSRACVYQSRSGRPDDPWLGPDVSDYLAAARASGLEAAVLCPVGFVCDHIEILFDLDVEAAAACRSVGLPMTRAAAVNDHPRFLNMMADVVLRTWKRYERGRGLEIAPPQSPIPNR
jgi:protoporphyrin/coproporphyrin ferrochelatase